jgi:hypothetical protein
MIESRLLLLLRLLLRCARYQGSAPRNGDGLELHCFARSAGPERFL